MEWERAYGNEDMWRIKAIELIEEGDGIHSRGGAGRRRDNEDACENDEQVERRTWRLCPDDSKRLARVKRRACSTLVVATSFDPRGAMAHRERVWGRGQNPGRWAAATASHIQPPQDRPPAISIRACAGHGYQPLLPRPPCT